MLDPISIQNYFYENIPISSALGIKLKQASEQKVILSAPIAKNINHKKTVFGGSLHAVATLSCWTLIYINLKKLNIVDSEIIISASTINYLQPVTDDFEVLTEMNDPKEWTRFIKILNKFGKARIQLEAKILTPKGLAVDFLGTFAALKNQ